MRRMICAALLLAGCSTAPSAPKSEGFTLHARRGDEATVLNWKPAETAVIICDMWDTHTCQGAAQRVTVMAPRLNAFVAAARRQGALIVHAPSDVIKFYEGTPQRKRVKDAPVVKAPMEIKGRRLDLTREGPLPVDDSDWCDCPTKCPVESYKTKGWPWTRQIATIDIAPEDVISADGQEMYNLFEPRGIKNVILTGVHTNMCVVGRSFGIRQMVMLGRNVVLARDLTDCLYDPKKPPHVSHDRGTELIVGHIEKYWCPSFLSTDITGTASVGGR